MSVGTLQFIPRSWHMFFESRERESESESAAEVAVSSPANELKLLVSHYSTVL